jgi:hypothetical protein
MQEEGMGIYDFAEQFEAGYILNEYEQSNQKQIKNPSR